MVNQQHLRTRGLRLCPAHAVGKVNKRYEVIEFSFSVHMRECDSNQPAN